MSQASTKHRPFYRKLVLTSLIHADLVTLLNRDWVHDVRDNHMPLPCSQRMET